jgi:hypothetical protein
MAKCSRVDCKHEASPGYKNCDKCRKASREFSRRKRALLSHQQGKEPSPLCKDALSGYVDGRSVHLKPEERSQPAPVTPAVGSSVPAPAPTAAKDPLDFEVTIVAPTPTKEEQTREQLTIARLRKEVSDAKAQVREFERLALTGDAVRDLLGTLGAPNVRPDPEWLRGAKEQRSVTGTAVLFLSDIHGDEVVAPSQVGGRNEYNREIMLQRMRNCAKSAIVLCKRFMAAPKYDGIVVPLGGDIVSGNIHEELSESNEAPIQQTMLVMEEVLIECLGALADEFGKIFVPCVTGNHGRMHKKPRAKNRAFENHEWLIYQRLASYFKRDQRFTFDIPDGSDSFFNIYKQRFCLTHGDQFRGGDGVGGILVPIRRGLSRKQFRQNAMGDPFDVMLIGHWHQYVQMSDLVINGSVKGLDEYAYQGNFAFERPTQALFVCHPELGITARWPIFCDYEGGQVKKL